VRVQFGIVCDHCRIVHLIASKTKSSRIQYDRPRGEFKLTCIPPCTAVMHFSRGMLLPYAVPDDALIRGYVEIDRCTPMVRSTEALKRT
jgi:hypothetical protein